MERRTAHLQVEVAAAADAAQVEGGAAAVGAPCQARPSAACVERAQQRAVEGQPFDAAAAQVNGNGGAQVGGRAVGVGIQQRAGGTDRDRAAAGVKAAQQQIAAAAAGDAQGRAKGIGSTVGTGGGEGGSTQIDVAAADGDLGRLGGAGQSDAACCAEVDQARAAQGAGGDRDAAETQIAGSGIERSGEDRAAAQVDLGGLGAAAQGQGRRGIDIEQARSGQGAGVDHGTAEPDAGAAADGLQGVRRQGAAGGDLQRWIDPTCSGVGTGGGEGGGTQIDVAATDGDLGGLGAAAQGQGRRGIDIEQARSGQGAGVDHGTAEPDAGAAADGLQGVRRQGAAGGDLQRWIDPTCSGVGTGGVEGGGTQIDVAAADGDLGGLGGTGQGDAACGAEVEQARGAQGAGADGADGRLEAQGTVAADRVAAGSNACAAERHARPAQTAREGQGSAGADAQGPRCRARDGQGATGRQGDGGTLQAHAAAKAVGHVAQRCRACGAQAGAAADAQGAALVESAAAGQAQITADRASPQLQGATVTQVEVAPAADAHRSAKVVAGVSKGDVGGAGGIGPLGSRAGAETGAAGHVKAHGAVPLADGAASHQVQVAAAAHERQGAKAQGAPTGDSCIAAERATQLQGIGIAQAQAACQNADGRAEVVAGIVEGDRSTGAQAGWAANDQRGACDLLNGAVAASGSDSQRPSNGGVAAEAQIAARCHRGGPPNRAAQAQSVAVAERQGGGAGRDRTDKIVAGIAKVDRAGGRQAGGTADVDRAAATLANAVAAAEVQGTTGQVAED